MIVTAGKSLVLRMGRCRAYRELTRLEDRVQAARSWGAGMEPFPVGAPPATVSTPSMAAADEDLPSTGTVLAGH